MWINVILWLFSGCSGKECTEEANPSLSLVFVDVAGNPAVPDSVEWYHNDAAMGEIDVIESQMYIGSDLSGTFKVLVTSEGQVQTIEETVVFDGCHVDTISREIQLPSSGDCNDIQMPSVIVSAVDLSGERIQMSNVEFSLDGGAFQSAVCWNECDEWIAGVEQEGSFNILGFYDDPLSGQSLQESGSVQVRSEQCHVVTEELELTFETNTSSSECSDIVEDGWNQYFDGQVGCGDLQLYATIEGGFQQLVFTVPEVLDSIDVGQTIELSLPDEATVLLQFGEALDEAACEGEASESRQIEHEFTAIEGTALLSLYERTEQSSTVSVRLDSVVLDNGVECTTTLAEYIWDSVVVPQ